MSQALEKFFEVQRKASKPLGESEEVAFFTSEVHCDEYCDACGALVSLSKAGAQQIIEFAEGFSEAYDAVLAEDKSLKVAKKMTFDPWQFGISATVTSSVSDELIQETTSVGVDFDAITSDEDTTEMKIDNWYLDFYAHGGAYLRLYEKYSDYQIEVPLTRNDLEKVIAYSPEESSSPKCG